MKELTTYAQTALVELFEMRVVCSELVRDLQRAEEKLAHTLEGHDLAFEYHLQDPEVPKRAEVLGIRIRHQNWRPKITVWGQRSMMESFLCDNLTEEVKNKIRDCIDKTITQT